MTHGCAVALRICDATFGPFCYHVRQGAVGRTGEPPSATEKARMTMQTMQNAAEWKDRRPVLSTLWIFLVLNYLFADVYA
jgi:hypothetical protein